MRSAHCLLLASLTWAGCTKQAPPPATSDVLATVGTRPIRAADLEREATRRVALGQALPAKEALLEDLVIREAMLARALELGLAEQPEMRRRYENILLAELKARELQPRLLQAQVSPEALRAAGAKEAQRQPAQVRLAVLRFSVSPRTSADKRAQLAERLVEARAKASHLPPNEAGFGALAVDYSDDQATRYLGGDVGWFDVGRTNYSMPNEILAAGQSLTHVGEISQVLRLERGIFLVRLMERRDAGQPLPGAADAVVRQRLLAQERKRIEAEFAAETRLHARVQINTQAVASVRLTNPQQMAQGDTSARPPAMP